MAVAEMSERLTVRDSLERFVAQQELFVCEMKKRHALELETALADLCKRKTMLQRVPASVLDLWRSDLETIFSWETL